LRPLPRAELDDDEMRVLRDGSRWRDGLSANGDDRAHPCVSGEGGDRARYNVFDGARDHLVRVGSDELPSFFSRGSGICLEHQIAGAEEGARLMRARFDVLGQGGMLFAVPPPEETALPRAEVEQHLAAAMKQADGEGIRGKQVTPFLLGELVKRTGGRTLQANLALLENNARFAAELAVAYASLG